MAGCECCDNFSMIDGGDEFKAFPGLKGDDGTTFYPHVSAEGILGWTNDGGKPNPAPVNIKGADGKSAYAAAAEAGFTGTEAEFNAYLSGIGDLTDEVADQKSIIDDLSALVDRKAGMLVDTASGAIASFVPDSTITDLLNVSVNIEPVQSGSGDPSPDNVRPISGWTAVGIERTGVNVFDKSLMADASSGAKYITLNLAPNTDYTMSTDDPCKNGGTITDLFFCRMDEAASSGANGVKLGKTVTRTSDADGHLRVGYRCYEDWITPAQLVAYSTQVEAGTAATAFEPFVSPTTFTIALGQTVYGGTVDAVNGTMTVEWAKIVYNGSETWYPYGIQGYCISRDDMAKELRYKGILKSDILPTYQSNYGGDFLAAQYGITGWANVAAPNQNYIYVKCGEVSATDQTVIKAWLQENPLTVIYELATPFEIQLDPVTIAAISGQTNNVWSNAGDVSVEYAADLKTYIDSKIAAAVAALS